MLRGKYPEAEIVICADNDAWVDSNVGVIKAREAAFLIGAKLAVPTFSNVSTKPTDFNDLMRLQGIEVVRCQLLSAQLPLKNRPRIVIRPGRLP